MLDRLLGRSKASKRKDLQQTKITHCFAKDSLQPNFSEEIGPVHLQLTNIEYQVFHVLGQILRNASFKTLDDAYEKISRRMLYQKNP